MNKKIRILTSAVTNPWFNLATEDWIFRILDPNTHILFLWRNADSVVIGRNQNPWVECKIDKMEADKVYLARRQSGGGAVFHDLGNTNFTFLSPIAEYDPQANFQIIINALANLGIVAQVKGRNDLVVGDKKISGSAFKQAKDRAFHHGTLLINADMSKLADYLNPSKLKLAAKGVKSVRARVANLVEFNANLTHEIVSSAIIDSFCDFYNTSAEVENLDERLLKQEQHLNSYYEKMSDWNWRFGKSPEFSHKLETRFEWGMIDLRMDIKNAIIADIALFSDALDTNLIDDIKTSLLNVVYNPDAISKALAKLKYDKPEIINYVDDFSEWLIKSTKN